MKGFSTGRDCKWYAVLQKDFAELADRWSAVHISHWVVYSPNCRAGIDSSIIVYRADFLESVMPVSWWHAGEERGHTMENLDSDARKECLDLLARGGREGIRRRDL